MYGFWYSVRQHYSFTRKEVTEVFWTSAAFALMLTFYFKDVFVISGDVRLVLSYEALFFLVFMSLAVFVAMYAHVALQKIVGIKFGYKVTYQYWLNAILVGLFLSVLTLGKVPLLSVFILPGSVMLESVPNLRVGRFQTGINSKDIARISFAGPLAHIIIATFLGVIYLAIGKNTLLFQIITANLLLMIYSMLPIPKISMPSKMGGASDGFGIFFYSRPIYVFVSITLLFYAVLIWTSTTFSLVAALLLGLITMFVYNLVSKK